MRSLHLTYQQTKEIGPSMKNLRTRTDRAQKVLGPVLKEIPTDEKQSKGHDINHINRVWKAGLEIGKKEKANIEVLEPALLLHDIKRPNDEMAEKNHAVVSATYATRILKKFGYLDKEIKEISEAIRTHSRSSLTDRPATIEAKIVYDADKQDGLGKEGIKRAVALGKDRNWDSAQTAEWYLARICDVIKNQPFFTKTGIEIDSRKFNFSLQWCKKNISEARLKTIIKKFGFENVNEIALSKSPSSVQNLVRRH